MNKTATIASLMLTAMLIKPIQSVAQPKEWTMEECIAYAVEHSATVKQKELSARTAKAEKQEAVAAFLPSISASTAAQYAWGRNIDPETNTYNNVTTFYNSYGIYASLTVFDGGQTYNAWREATNERRRTMNALEQSRDDKAIAVMQAYIDCVYAQGCLRLAEDKLKTSTETLRQTRVEEELGIKSRPDVAQIESELAQDEYNLVHQQNVFNTSRLTLLTEMNLAAADTVGFAVVSSEAYDTFAEPDDSTSLPYLKAYAADNAPEAIEARLQAEQYRLRYLSSKGGLMPTISLQAGVSTTYYKNLTDGVGTETFRRQFKNNMGEYVAVSLSIPLFDRLSGITTMRRARNSWRDAEIQRDETLRKLNNKVEQAVMDRDGYARETISMKRKVEADSLSYSMQRAQFSEGMVTAIDLKTAANTLLESRIGLLQRQMLYLLKDRLVDYYKGKKLW